MGSTNSLLIRAAESSSDGVTDQLFSSLYSELHRLAKRELARQWSPISLSVTTLLHEAYLDMAGGKDPLFPDRARFMGYAARVMRGLIIDHARNRSALKRGGKFEITAVHEKYGKQTTMVEVKDNDHTTVDVKVKASDAKSGN